MRRRRGNKNDQDMAMLFAFGLVTLAIIWGAVSSWTAPTWFWPLVTIGALIAGTIVAVIIVNWCVHQLGNWWRNGSGRW